MASGISIQKLTKVGRRQIGTPVTLALTNEAVRPFYDASEPLEDVQITFLPHQEEFMVLLATAHVSDVAHLCMENSNSLQAKVVQQISLHWDGSGVNMLVDISH